MGGLKGKVARMGGASEGKMLERAGLKRKWLEWEGLQKKRC